MFFVVVVVSFPPCIPKVVILSFGDNYSKQNEFGNNCMGLDLSPSFKFFYSTLFKILKNLLVKIKMNIAFIH